MKNSRKKNTERWLLKWLPRFHYWIAFIITLPFTIILITGVLLMLRHHFEGIQPKKVATGHQELLLDFAAIQKNITNEFKSGSLSSDKINKLVLRPSGGLIEVFMDENIHVQMDGKTGDILNIAPRYTSLLITLHEGVFFHKWIRDGVFLPTSVFVVFLLITGLFLMKQRWAVRVRSKRKNANNKSY